MKQEDLFRPAHCTEYLHWLVRWLDQGGTATHYASYPFQRAGFLIAQHSFTTHGECGADSRHILVPEGVHHLGGGQGHNDLYFFEGPECHGVGYIPAYSDSEFRGLDPRLDRFIERQERQVSRLARELGIDRTFHMKQGAP